jgi:hypothetical protein
MKIGRVSIIPVVVLFALAANTLFAGDYLGPLVAVGGDNRTIYAARSTVLDGYHYKGHSTINYRYRWYDVTSGEPGTVVAEGWSQNGHLRYTFQSQSGMTYRKKFKFEVYSAQDPGSPASDILYVYTFNPEPIVYKYDTTTEGWSFSGVTGFSLPASSYSNTRLIQTAKNNASTWGYWYSPEVDFSKGVLYRARFRVMSDITDASDVPQLNCRLQTSGGGDTQSSFKMGGKIVVNSPNDRPYIVPNSSGREYEVFMYYSNLIGGLPSKMRAYFDLLNFDPDDSATGDLQLDFNGIKGFIYDSFGWSSSDKICTYDGSENGKFFLQNSSPYSGNDWNFGYPSGFSQPTTTGSGKTQLVLASVDNNTFGYWWSPQISIYRTNHRYVYRAIFAVTTTQADQSEVPELRLRALDEQFEEVNTIEIHSIGSDNGSPTPGVDRLYEAIFIPPACFYSSQNSDSDTFSFAFDLRTRNMTNPDSGDLILKKFELYRRDIGDMPYELDVADLSFSRSCYATATMNWTMPTDLPVPISDYSDTDRQVYIRYSSGVTNNSSDYPLDPNEGTLIGPVNASFEHLIPDDEIDAHKYYKYVVFTKDAYEHYSRGVKGEIDFAASGNYFNGQWTRISPADDSRIMHVVNGDLLRFGTDDLQGSAMPSDKYLSWTIGSDQEEPKRIANHMEGDDSLRWLYYWFLQGEGQEFIVSLRVVNGSGSQLVGGAKIILDDAILPGTTCSYNSDSDLSDKPLVGSLVSYDIKTEIQPDSATNIPVLVKHYGPGEFWLPNCFGVTSPLTSHAYFHPDQLFDNFSSSDNYVPLPLNFNKDKAASFDIGDPAVTYSLPLEQDYFHSNPYERKERSNNAVQTGQISNITSTWGNLKQARGEDTLRDSIDTIKKTDRNTLELDLAGFSYIRDIAMYFMRSLFDPSGTVNLSSQGGFSFKDAYDNFFPRQFTFYNRNRRQHPIDSGGTGTSDYYPGSGGYADYNGVYLLTEKLYTHVNEKTDANNISPLLKNVPLISGYTDIKPLDSGDGTVSAQDFYELVKTINKIADHGSKTCINLYLSPVFQAYTNKILAYGWNPSPTAVHGEYSIGDFFTDTTNVTPKQKNFIHDLFVKFKDGYSGGNYSITTAEANRAYRNLWGLILIDESESVDYVAHDTGVSFDFATCHRGFYREPGNPESWRPKINVGKELEIELSNSYKVHGDLNNSFTDDAKFHKAPPILYAIAFITKDAYGTEFPAVVINCCGDTQPHPGDSGTFTWNYKVGAGTLPVPIVRASDMAYDFSSRRFSWQCDPITNVKFETNTISQGNITLPSDIEDHTEDTQKDELKKMFQCYATKYADNTYDSFTFKFWGEVQGISENPKIYYDVSQVYDMGTPMDIGDDTADSIYKIRLYFMEHDGNIAAGDRLITIKSTYYGVPRPVDNKSFCTDNNDGTPYFDYFDDLGHARLYDVMGGAVDTSTATPYAPDPSDPNNLSLKYNPFATLYIPKDDLEHLSGNRLLYRGDMGDNDIFPNLLFLGSGPSGICFDIYSQIKGFNQLSTFDPGTGGSSAFSKGAGTPFNLIPKASGMQSSMQSTFSNVLKPNQTKTLTSTPPAGELSRQQAAEWFAQMIKHIRDQEDMIYGTDVPAGERFYIPILCSTVQPSVMHDPITFEDLVREQYAAIPTPKPPLDPLLVGNDLVWAGYRQVPRVLQGASETFYQTDHAANFYTYQKYTETLRRKMDTGSGTKKFIRKGRAFIAEANMITSGLFTDPQNIDPEYDLGKLHFRDRYLLNLLDRNPGMIGSEYERCFSYNKQMKIISLALDYAGYSHLRTEYKTLQPSALIDITYAYYKNLEDFANRDKRLFTLADIHSWVLYSLNNGFNLDFVVDEDDAPVPPATPPPNDPSDINWHDQWHWFGLLSLTSGQPWATVDDNYDMVDTALSGKQKTSDAYVGTITVPGGNWNESMPVYVDSSSTRKFQIKPWYGCTEANEMSHEYEDHKVSCVVAYLRSAENQVEESGDPSSDYTPPAGIATKYQMQLWRNIDTSTPPNKGQKWNLEKFTNPAHRHSSSWAYLRLPLQGVGSSDQLVLKINTSKFASGNYEYFLISLDKLEEKLHLMSKYPQSLGGPVYYAHIEDNLDRDKVFSESHFEGLRTDITYLNNPIVASGSFASTDSPKQIQITSLSLENPEIPPPGKTLSPIVLSDFMLVIQPN